MSTPSLAGPLAIPAFRRLWFGGLASNLGTMVQTVGAGWLMATISPAIDMVALVQAATTLPVMLFSILAGALADSYERRRLLMVAQVFMMTVALILSGVVALGQITPWLLLTLSFLLGCGTALHTPSWQASVGDVVPRPLIPEAVTLNSMGVNLTRSVGPALGGVIVALTGAATAFAFNAVSFLPMIHALMRLKPVEKSSALPRENLATAVGAGLRYVAMSPNLMTITLRAFVFGAAAVVILALLPVVARDLLQGDAFAYGLLLGAFGVGAVGGGLANSWLRKRCSGETIVRIAFGIIAVSACLTGLSRNLWLTSLVLIPAGAAWVLALSLFNVAMQLSTPRWVVGRTLSIYQTAVFGGMTVGGWLWGHIAEAMGVPYALASAAAVAALGAAIGLRFALPILSNLDLGPLNSFATPALQIGVQDRSGPIFVMIEYDIAQDDIPAFLAAMTARRRIRLRDGARQWTLLRDLERPNLWKEAYHLPTWADYLRHNHRRTQMDAGVSENLLALNRGQVQPQVRRMIEHNTVPERDDMALKPFLDLH